MSNPFATASLENLYRIFTVPEGADSALGEVDREISENLAQFLQQRIVAQEMPLEEIEQDFSSPHIPDHPHFVSDYTEFLLDKLVAQSVHTTAPGFIGHMATPLPYFMLPLARIMTALNQNLVKIETSKAFTPLERQVIAMLHHLIYKGDENFYERWMHDAGHALGVFCSGGTIASTGRVLRTWAWARRRIPSTGARAGGMSVPSAPGAPRSRSGAAQKPVGNGCPTGSWRSNG